MAISRDGRTAVALAGAGADPNEMVKPATDVKHDVQSPPTARVQVHATGTSALWSDFDEADLKATLTSEMLCR